MERKVYYVAMGDSLTEGIGASHPSCSFVSRYFHSIKTTADCYHVNWGRSGMTSGELLNSLSRPSVAKEYRRATNITITIGGNDLIQAYQSNSNEAHVLTAIPRLKSNMEQILHHINLQNPYAHVSLMGLYNPGSPDNPLYSIANKVIRSLNTMYRRLVNKYRYQFVDPFQDFLNKPYLLADEVHPNDLGHQVISRLFLEKFGVPLV